MDLVFAYFDTSRKSCVVGTRKKFSFSLEVLYVGAVDLFGSDDTAWLSVFLGFMSTTSRLPFEKIVPSTGVIFIARHAMISAHLNILFTVHLVLHLLSSAATGIFTTLVVRSFLDIDWSWQNG